MRQNAPLHHQPGDEGKVNLRCEFTADRNGQMVSGGRSSRFANGKQVAEGRLERALPVVFTACAGMDIYTLRGHE